ncbi:hypothetical protein BD310DRAFT_230791 [Dichomitus squalens]|uniref:Uncharacterized protein n=1 Tax=Dichomitus squalens TaxID=114155 RepID=A0A4Q9PCC9_9APHY|nr:hypothetical protein BD310DRAFT_230791 [Dichomitus squalens]
MPRGLDTRRHQSCFIRATRIATSPSRTVLSSWTHSGCATNCLPSSTSMVRVLGDETTWDSYLRAMFTGGIGLDMRQPPSIVRATAVQYAFAMPEQYAVPNGGWGCDDRDGGYGYSVVGAKLTQIEAMHAEPQKESCQCRGYSCRMPMCNAYEGGTELSGLVVYTCHVEFCNAPGVLAASQNLTSSSTSACLPLAPGIGHVQIGVCERARQGVGRPRGYSC